jgi:hypothetical protein
MTEGNEGLEPSRPVLLVLGNGFDLACGLKTRYGDFFKNQYNNNPTFKDFMVEPNSAFYADHFGRESSCLHKY